MTDDDQEQISSFPNSKTILTVGILSEAIILIIALVWVWLRGLSLPLDFSYSNLIAGLKATGPLIAFNFGVFGVLAYRSRYTIYKVFLHEIVLPVAAPLNFFSAFIIAVAAGFAEEILFRGVLNPELTLVLGPLLGTCLGSFLFAYIHFIGRALDFWQLLLFYFLFGLYFSYLTLDLNNLAVAIVCHASYNYIALMYLRYVELFRWREGQQAASKI